MLALRDVGKKTLSLGFSALFPRQSSEGAKPQEIEMKLTIAEVRPFMIERSSNDNVVLQVITDDGAVHTIELMLEAQKVLVAGLLATQPDPPGTTPRRYQKAIKVQATRTSEDRVGLRLFLTEQAALHVLLDRELAHVLRLRLTELERSGSRQ